MEQETRNPAAGYSGGARNDDHVGALISFQDIPPTSKQQDGFDYSALPVAHIADAVRSAAERIRSRMMEGIIETGRDLIEVKAILEHGQFGRWLDAEFGMTGRTARNYMNAVAVADTKPEIISVLPPTVIYKLASPSTPDSARTDVIARLERGEALSTRNIGRIISMARSESVMHMWEDNNKADAACRRKRRRKERQWQQWETRRLREREKDEQDTDIAAQRCIDLLRSSLGDDFRHFLDLVARAGKWNFLDYLTRARRTDGSPS